MQKSADPYAKEFAKALRVRPAGRSPVEFDLGIVEIAGIISAVFAVLSFVFDRITERARGDWQNSVTDRLKVIQEQLALIVNELRAIEQAIATVPVYTTIEGYRSQVKSAEVDFEAIRTAGKKLDAAAQRDVFGGPFKRLSEALSGLCNNPEYGFAHYQTVILAVVAGTTAAEYCPRYVTADILRRDVLAKILQFLLNATDIASTNTLSLTRLRDKADDVSRIAFGNIKAYVGPDNSGAWFRISDFVYVNPDRGPGGRGGAGGIRDRLLDNGGQYRFLADRYSGDPSKPDHQEGFQRQPEVQMGADSQSFPTYPDFPGYISDGETEKAIIYFNDRFVRTADAFRAARTQDVKVRDALQACIDALKQFEELDAKLEKLGKKSPFVSVREQVGKKPKKRAVKKTSAKKRRD